MSEEKTELLLPCPFCGGEAIESEYQTSDGKSWDCVVCRSCEARAESVTAWNIRNYATFDIILHEAREALEVARDLASIAYNWDLGQNGKVEINGEWVSCYDLMKRFAGVARRLQQVENTEVSGC